MRSRKAADCWNTSFRVSSRSTRRVKVWVGWSDRVAWSSSAWAFAGGSNSCLAMAGMELSDRLLVNRRTTSALVCSEDAMAVNRETLI
ncbi:hypothetical protein D9M68_974860 [compost metagenome]